MKTIKIRPVLIESKEKSCKGDLVINSISELGIHIVDTEPSFHNKQELSFISLEDEKVEIGSSVACFEDRELTKFVGLSKLEEDYGNSQGWCYDKDSKLYTHPLNYIYFFREVIALQPQIPITYIQQFIEEYNAGNVKDVKIEVESGIKIEFDIEYPDQPVSNIYKPKLTNGFVTIVNDRLFNESNVEKIDINKYLEEALELAKKNKLITDSDKNYFIYAGQIEALESVIDYIKSIYINTAILYTGEEMLTSHHALLQAMKFNDNYSHSFINKWFEDLKKK